MRYLLLLVAPAIVCAQSSDSGDKVTQALISEIQQLRLAIERSTLLNARTQLAISQLQMQETTAARLNSQLNDVRAQVDPRMRRLQQEAQDLERKISSAPDSTRGLLELQLKEMKREIDDGTAREQQRSTRESELAIQVQNAQNDVAGSRSRIAELERALDTAIQQLLKQK